MGANRASYLEQQIASKQHEISKLNCKYREILDKFDNVKLILNEIGEEYARNLNDKSEELSILKRELENEKHSMFALPKFVAPKNPMEDSMFKGFSYGVPIVGMNGASPMELLAKELTFENVSHMLNSYTVCPMPLESSVELISFYNSPVKHRRRHKV